MSASSKSSTQSVCGSRSHHQQTFEMLYEMRANTELCDITLKTGNLTLPAHRVVLAATSPFFRQEFSSAEGDKPRKELSLPASITPDSMAVILDFFYTGNLNINTKMVEDLLITANLLKNEQAIQVTVESALANITISNCLHLQQTAKRFNLVDMIDKIDRFIEWNFENISKEPTFLSLEAEEVKDIIKRDKLKVTQEEIVYDAVYNWYMHERHKRHESAERVFEEVRFCQIPEDVLRKKVVPEIVDIEDLCSSQIEKAMAYHRDPKNQPHRPRKPIICLYVISRKDSIVERFDPVYGVCVPCYRMVPLDEQDGEYRCAVKVGDQLYTVFESRIERFDVEGLYWQTVGPGMDTRGAAVCSGKNCIYVVGGRVNGENVYRYDVKKSVWTTLPSMPESRRSPGVALVGTRLYVIGGYSEKDGPLSSVNCYNTKQEKWLAMKPLNVGRFQFGVGVIDNVIYVLGGRNNTETLASIEVLELKSKTWTLLDNSLVEARNDFGVVAQDNEIFCFGGLGIKSVEKFNIEDHVSKVIGSTGINSFAIDSVLFNSL